MKKLMLSKDCILEKDCAAITKELMKGSFIIACDINEKKQIVLQNVFHYTAAKRLLEYYSLFPDEKNERRMLRLEMGIMITGCRDVYKDIYGIIEHGLVNFDTFIIDKHNNLYTEVVYDKYGGSMRPQEYKR